MGSSGVLWTFVASVGLAMTIIAASLLPAFCLYPVFYPGGPLLNSDIIANIGVVALLGIPIAVFLRRKNW